MIPTNLHGLLHSSCIFSLLLRLLYENDIYLKKYAEENNHLFRFFYIIY